MTDCTSSLDNDHCSVHYTDQQYTIDPVSGNVTVEWEGTGPDQSKKVKEFDCEIIDETEKRQIECSKFTSINIKIKELMTMEETPGYCC